MIKSLAKFDESTPNFKYTFAFPSKAQQIGTSGAIIYSRRINFLIILAFQFPETYKAVNRVKSLSILFLRKNEKKKNIKEAHLA